MQRNATRALFELGVGADVARVGAVLRQFKFCAQHGEILAQIDLVGLRGDKSVFIGVERAKLQHALLSAAPASSPMMGQGGCMAIEDAVVLAEVLQRSQSVKAGLDAFVARRRPRVDWVQAQSDTLGRKVLLSAAVRDAALRERGAQAFQERYAPLLGEP